MYNKELERLVNMLEGKSLTIGDAQSLISDVRFLIARVRVYHGLKEINIWDLPPKYGLERGYWAERLRELDTELHAKGHTLKKVYEPMV